MIQLTSKSRILVAKTPADFRKGIDGFVALCEYELNQTPRCGTLFVFINRKSTMIRILHYESQGYWLMTKRLSKGRYRDWPKGEQSLTAIESIRLRQLLAGLSAESSEHG